MRTCEGTGIVMGEVCYNCHGTGRLGKKFRFLRNIFRMTLR